MRRAIIYLSFLLIFFGVFCAHISHAAGPTRVMYPIDQPTTWAKENSPYLVYGQIKITAPLTIEAGVIVKFGTGSNDGLNIQSDFFANGTADEKVIFTSRFDDAHGGDTDGDHGYYKPHSGDWISLSFNPYGDKILDIENASILYSNFGISIYSSNNYSKNRTVKNCELKNNGYGIIVYNAEPVIENNVISNNQFGIGVNASTRITEISNNSIFDNETGAVGNNPANPSLGALDAKNNWWGDRSGPSRADNPDGGDSVSGLVSFDPWLKQDPAHIGDPVIIIPGILGSWKKDGEWQIDPIFHTYDNLYDEFSANGYVPEEDLFTLPYEWRDSNKVNAVALRGKIQQIKNKTHKPKVDIVAHSMGGLLAREYIESSYYNNDVDQLITVGTPNLGAPKSYLTWEGGSFGPKIEDYVSEKIFNQEAKENGFSDIFHYIHDRPMLSVKELLPVYNYLFDVNNNYNSRETYPTNYPQNNFLENLNNSANTESLKKIEFTKIIGEYKNIQNTISGFNVENSNEFGLWQHGYPENFWLLTSNRGLIRGDGDGTVPLISAESASIPANRTIAFQSEHNDLPTEAQKDILEILTGKTPASEIRKTHIPNILLILVYSPVDIQIQSPSGQKVGKNFANGSEFDQIPGAFYSGYRADQEFVTIPNPEDGEYKVLSEGTGTGEYTIETTKITKDESNPQGAAESTATITGTAESKVQEENKIEIVGDSVKKMEPLTLFSKKSEKKEEEKINTKTLQDAPADTQIKTVPSSDVSAQPSESLTKIQRADDLKNSVRDYFKTKLVRKKGERDYLLGWLGNIRVHLKKQQMLLEKSKISQKTDNKYQKEVIGHCDRLIAHIRKNSPKNIDSLVAEILIANLNELKNF